MRKTETLLKQAEASAHLAAAHFARCRDAIDQARALHDRCWAAIGSASLEEIIRLRNLLALEMIQRG
jgi:hypothetical protein